MQLHVLNGRKYDGVLFVSKLINISTPGITMTLLHVVTGDFHCQDVNIEMAIMTSVIIYDITQAEILFLSSCGII